MIHFIPGTEDSYLDEHGECICEISDNMLDSTDDASTRSLARSERKRQRAFLKKHTTITRDSHKKRRKRKHRKRQLNYVTDSPLELNAHLISEIISNRRLKRDTTNDRNNLTHVEGNIKVPNNTF